MNYFVVNTPSNLITNVISTSYTPLNTKIRTFVKATDKALNSYYRWCEKNPDLCPDVGDIVSQCNYLKDSFNKGKAKAVANNLSRRYREPVQDHTTFQGQAEERESEIRAYILKHPDTSPLDLSDVFLCGVVAAKAYLAKYQP